MRYYLARNFNRVKQVLNRLSGKDFIIALFGTASVVGLVFLCSGGFYYQTESDTVFPTYMFGMYSGGSNVLPNTFGCFSGISYWFNLVYSYGISSDIYDWFQLISVFCCAVYWVHSLIRARKTPWLMIPVLVSLLDPILPFEFSKTAMFLSITGLHVLTEKTGFFPIITGVFLVSLGFLVRPEPVVISMVIFFLATLLNFPASQKKLTALVLPFLSVTFLSLVFLNSERTTEDAYYKEFRKYEYTLVDFRKGLINEVGLKPTDKIKLQAAQKFFFADREELNLDFFRELDIQPLDKTPISLVKAFSKSGWVKNGWGRFTEGVFCLKFHFLTLLLTALLLWKKNRAEAWLLVLSTFIIVLFSVFLKTEHHFITSTMMAALLLTGVSKDKLPSKTEATSLPKRGLIIVLVMILSTLMFLEKARLVSTSKKKSDYYQLVQNKLEDFQPNSLVFNISYWDKLHYRLFSTVQPKAHDKVVVIDGGALYLNGNYQTLMYNMTGENRFVEQFLYLVKEEKIFVSSRERMELITNYMNVVHGLDLHFITLMVFNKDDSSLNTPTIGLHQFSQQATPQ